MVSSLTSDRSRMASGCRKHRAVVTYAKEGVYREIEITYQTA